MKGYILEICYIASTVMVIPTILFDYNKEFLFQPLLAVAWILAMTGIIISLIEIIRSEKLKVTGKTLWILSILALYTIGQLLYILSRRKYQ